MAETRIQPKPFEQTIEEMGPKKRQQLGSHRHVETTTTQTEETRFRGGVTYKSSPSTSHKTYDVFVAPSKTGRSLLSKAGYNLATTKNLPSDLRAADRSLQTGTKVIAYKIINKDGVNQMIVDAPKAKKPSTGEETIYVNPLARLDEALATKREEQPAEVKPEQKQPESEKRLPKNETRETPPSIDTDTDDPLGGIENVATSSKGGEVQGWIDKHEKSITRGPLRFEYTQSDGRKTSFDQNVFFVKKETPEMKQEAESAGLVRMEIPFKTKKGNKTAIAYIRPEHFSELPSEALVKTASGSRLNMVFHSIS